MIGLGMGEWVLTVKYPDNESLQDVMDVFGVYPDSPDLFRDKL